MDVHPVRRHDETEIAIVIEAVVEAAIVVVLVTVNVVDHAVVRVDDDRSRGRVPVRKANPLEDVRPVRFTRSRRSVAVAAKEEASADRTVAVTAETRSNDGTKSDANVSVNTASSSILFFFFFNLVSLQYALLNSCLL